MRMSAKEIIGWEIIICKQNLWNGGELEMLKTDKYFEYQITIANSMKQEWEIDFCEVSALLDKYDLLSYIATCPANNGISCHCLRDFCML